MRFWLLPALLLLPVMARAQERVSVKGRIVNEQGEAVEYVQVGLPKRHIGTIPPDTLAFFHLSYQPASIQVYRIEGKPETFTHVLHKPVYFRIGESATPQDFDIEPEEPILLEPGRYFVAFQIVAADTDARRETEPHLYTALYLKSSYVRYGAMGELPPIPVNIGISIKGLEYQ